MESPEPERRGRFVPASDVPQADTVTGYGAGPFSDHSEFLEEHLFWIGHLAAFFHGRDVEELLLGPDYEATRDFSARSFEAADWPLFAVPLTAGGFAYIVYRTLPGDAAVDILVHRPGALRAEIVASTDSYATAPGLTWEELIDTARNGLPGGATRDEQERVLLLLPALGHYGELPADAVEVLTQALEACTAVDAPEPLATMLAAAHKDQLTLRL